MRKIRLLFSIICSSLLLTGSISISALADENVNSDVNVIPCSITWYSDINGDVPIEIDYNGVSVEFTYDDNMMRQSKVVGGEFYSTYNYVEGRLINERKQNCELEYQYIVENNTIRPNGFSYQGNEFTYGYEEGIIKYIFDSDQEIIAEYEYDVYGRLINTLHFDMSNDVEDEEMLPGNMNSLVGHGYVYDKETGFYYVAGMYYSPLVRSFLYKNQDVEFIEPEIAPLITVEDDIFDMYTSLMNNASHGNDIQYNAAGSGWCSNLSDQELLSRLIYGECTYADTGYHEQRAAIAYVVYNRVEYPGNRFPNTPRGVAIQAGEFAVISGDTNDTANARLHIEKTTTAWSEASNLACVLVCTHAAAVSINAYHPRPSGITNQMFFLSKGSWESKYNAENETVNNYLVTDIALNVGNIPSDKPRNIFFNYVNP